MEDLSDQAKVAAVEKFRSGSSTTSKASAAASEEPDTEEVVKRLICAFSVNKENVRIDYLVYSSFE